MLGLTQQDLGKIFNVSTQSISNKERGYTPFTDSEKKKLKDLIKEVAPNITIDDLFF